MGIAFCACATPVMLADFSGLDLSGMGAAAVGVAEPGIVALSGAGLFGFMAPATGTACQARVKFGSGISFVVLPGISGGTVKGAGAACCEIEIGDSAAMGSVPKGGCSGCHGRSQPIMIPVTSSTAASSP